MEQIDTSQTLTFERSRSPKMVLIGVAFLALGLWFVVSPDSFADTSRARRLGGEVGVTVVGALGALMGAAVLVTSIRHLRADGEALRLSPSGLSIEVGTAKLSDLPWKEVEGSRVVTVAGNDSLGIIVSRPERVIEHLRGPVRLVAAQQAKQYGTPVFIADSLVKANLSDVVAALDAYRAAHGQQAS